MPVTLHSIALHTMRHRAEWRQVNAEYERVREALEWADRVSDRLTPHEWRVLLAEYHRLRGVLYALLPQVEER